MSEKKQFIYRDLIAWQKGMDLVVLIYEASQHFPRDERFGLTAQVRKAAVAVPSNIAEGHGRLHRGDYVHQLSVANGSVREVETQILLAHRLGFIGEKVCTRILELTEELSRIISGLIRKLRSLPLPAPLSPLP